MWGEGGVAATALAMQAFRDAEANNPPPFDHQDLSIAPSSVWIEGSIDVPAFDNVEPNISPDLSVAPSSVRSEEAAQIAMPAFDNVEPTISPDLSVAPSSVRSEEAAEIDVPVHDDLDSHPLPARRMRGKGITICPEHHWLAFESKEAFKKHIKSHRKKFRCSQPNCPSIGHVFKIFHDLYAHVTKIHGSELLGKPSMHFQCGHCDREPTLRKTSLLAHLLTWHLIPSKKDEIATLGKVEQYCLPAEDPSSLMRTFTLAPEFLAPQKPELDQSNPKALAANQMQI